MSHYAAGAKFERKVRDKLYADGAALVIRSAGSKGPVDLVAVYRTHIIVGPVAASTTDPTISGVIYRLPSPRSVDFVQVKRNGRMSKTNRDELRELAKAAGARAVLAYPEKVGRRVEVRLEVL